MSEESKFAYRLALAVKLLRVRTTLDRFFIEIAVLQGLQARRTFITGLMSERKAVDRSMAEKA